MGICVWTIVQRLSAWAASPGPHASPSYFIFLKIRVRHVIHPFKKTKQNKTNDVWSLMVYNTSSILYSG
jgi:hypothetical protein